MNRIDRKRQRGQVMALFAIALAAIVLGVAVVVDGGYAFAQRRAVQNAADFAAMAGTRIVGQKLMGRPPGAGTASNVESAISSVLAANDAQLENAQYVDEQGHALGNVVGASGIPDGAFGVVVDARTNWKPFLLGILGLTEWAAASTATAITPGVSNGGGVLPLGIEEDIWKGLAKCPATGVQDCIDDLTPGESIISGGFAWLKFGLDDSKCPWDESLGMDDGGCETSQTFLDYQIGPPTHSFGCCGPVGQPDSVDKIGGLTGNEWGDLSYYIDHDVIVWVPIWDYAGDTGANAWYHIVGFGAIIFTGDNEHAKWLEGAAIDVTQKCAIDEEKNYCAAPGGNFAIGVTGEVKLVH